MIALRVSFCRSNSDALGQRLHLPLQVCLRELLAPAHPEAGSRQQRPPTPSLRIPRAADDRHPAGGPSQRLGHLTSTSPAIIIVVANVSFRPRLTGSGPKGTVGRNPTVGVA